MADAKKTRTNKWVFANLNENVSKQVWEIGQKYNERFKVTEKGKRIKHRNNHPIQLLKFWYYIYLKGDKLMQPLDKTPYRISIVNTPTSSWIEIRRLNEKRQWEADQAFPIFNEYEQKMWNLITDGGTAQDPEEIFQFKTWKSIKKENISGLLKTNFKADLRDTEGKLHKNEGITPNILRSMRQFSVIANYGVLDMVLIMQWFGWKDPRALYRFALIRSRLNSRNQVEVLRRSNLLTNLPVDLGKAVSSY